MAIDDSLEFYSPWPNLGEKLSEQWENLRTNMKSLHPVVRGTIADIEGNKTNEGALAGFTFGQQDFPNKFRIIWSGGNDQEFQFQCNEGTSLVPKWKTTFYVDCDGTEEKIVFDENVLFTKNANILGTFYGVSGGGGGGGGPDTDTVTITDGVKTLTSNNAKFSVNENDFYLDKDSEGNPKINSLALNETSAKDGTRTLTSPIGRLSFNDDQFYLDTDSEGNPKVNSIDQPTQVTFTDGTRTFSSSTSTVSVNQNHFYLDKDSNGNPKINLRDDIDEKSITVRFPQRGDIVDWWTPAQDITVVRGHVILRTNDGGFYPGVDWTVRYGTDPFDDSATELITGGTDSRFYPGPSFESIGTFDNPNIDADNYIRLFIKDLGEGDNKEESFHLTLHYKNRDV